MGMKNYRAEWKGVLTTMPALSEDEMWGWIRGLDETREWLIELAKESGSLHEEGGKWVGGVSDGGKKLRGGRPNRVIELTNLITSEEWLEIESIWGVNARGRKVMEIAKNHGIEVCEATCKRVVFHAVVIDRRIKPVDPSSKVPELTS